MMMLMLMHIKVVRQFRKKDDLLKQQNMKRFNIGDHPLTQEVPCKKILKNGKEVWRWRKPALNKDEDGNWVAFEEPDQKLKIQWAVAAKHMLGEKKTKIGFVNTEFVMCGFLVLKQDRVLNLMDLGTPSNDGSFIGAIKLFQHCNENFLPFAPMEMDVRKGLMIPYIKGGLKNC